MAAFDLPIDELEAYRPERSEPADFDAFWAETLATSRAAGGEPTFAPTSTPLRTIDVADVTFSGLRRPADPRLVADPRRWRRAPPDRRRVHRLRRRALVRPCPAVVVGGGLRAPGHGHPGQGSSWSPGDTPDLEDAPATGQYPGFTTRGIDDPRTAYWRRLITDAVLAVDAVAEHPAVDPERIVVTGQSQGGGLALAVAGLSERVRAAAIDVPFLCHWRRAVDVTDADSVSRGHPLPRHAAGPRRAGVREPRLLRWRQLRGPGAGAGALLGRADGRDLPALDRVRGLQPLRRPALDQRLAVQRSRRRRAPPGGRAVPVPRRAGPRALAVAPGRRDAGRRRAAGVSRPPRPGR